MDVDVDHDVPDFVQAWHPSVRRPVIPLDPTAYHEAIHPRAIFELRETPSSEYVSVVPYSCVYCRSVKQSCSRLLPCVRCTKTGRPCEATQPGYQKLPPPRKGAKPGKCAPTPVSQPISGMSQTPLVPSSKTITAPKSNQSMTNPSGPRPPKKTKIDPSELFKYSQKNF